MKSLQLGITILAAFMTVPSSVAWARLDSSQKQVFNQTVKKTFKGNYNDLYRNHGGFFNPESRSLIEDWLQHFGHEKLPKPEAQIIKDKNGKETLKLIMSQNGKTLTLTFWENNFETFEANGRKIQFSEVRDLRQVLQTLSDSDSNYRELAKSAKNSKTQTPSKQDLLTASQFGRLTPLEKVEFLMLLRQNVEAAQKVFDSKLKDQASLEVDPSSPLVVFHSLFASKIAWAGSIPQIGQKCIVAGNVSIYERTAGRLACNPFPEKDPNAFQPQPTFHNRCTSTGKGRMVACNPLLYGADSGGNPYCVDSGDRQRFTDQATADCNKASELHGESGSPERLADYERILKSYYQLQGGDAEKIKSCFGSDHRINEKCRDIFEPQLEAFKKFKDDAEKICETVQKKDQKDACVELKKRALDLALFTERIELKSEVIPEVNLIKQGCEKSKNTKWDEKTQDCFCEDGIRANYIGGNEYECPQKVAPAPLPVKVEKKDECQKEDGSKKHSFKCDPGLWIFGGIAAAVVAWFIIRDPKKPQPPTTLPFVPPTPTTPTTPTPTTPTTPSTPASEGGTGQSPSQHGGVRGTK